MEPRPTSGRASARAGRLARWGLACLASLAMHAGALLALRAAGSFAIPNVARTWPVALAPVQAAAWEANRARVPEPRAPEVRREIVTLPLPLRAERDAARAGRPPPADVRRLAMRDQTVERETVSSDAGALASALRAPEEAAGGRRESGERGGEEIAGAGRSGTPDADAEPALPRSPAPPEEAFARPDSPSDPGARPHLDSGVALAGGASQRVEGGPSAAAPERDGPRPGGGPNLDDPGLEKGPETRVDTRRFAPAAYWIDVQARIQGEWEGRARAATARMDPDEDTYFYKKRTAVVGLALDPAGAVREVHVVESSRLDLYDALAVAVIREQQPYPPPPPAAIGRDGSAKVRIRFQWSPSVFRRALR